MEHIVSDQLLGLCLHQVSPCNFTSLHDRFISEAWRGGELGTAQLAPSPKETSCKGDLIG